MQVGLPEGTIFICYNAIEALKPLSYKIAAWLYYF